MYPNARIPVGSWILVTGVNGLVASTTANLLLEMGYKVRGTVRSPAKTNWIQEKFDTLYGKGNFELVAAEDLAKEGAFDEAVKGIISTPLAFPNENAKAMKESLGLLISPR